MKSSLWTIILLLPVMAQCSYADSIPIFTTQANISFGPNFGGDNQFSIFQAPGVRLRATGDASCSWCGLADSSLTPGSSLSASIPNGGLDWVSVLGNVTIGGHGFGCGGENCGLAATGLTALGSFAFPTIGHKFTVTVPASINGPIIGELATGQTLALQVASGKLVLTFDFVPAGNGVPAYYQLSQGVFTTSGFTPTPEPGTLALMASGLAGMLGICLKRRHRKTGLSVRTYI